MKFKLGDTVRVIATPCRHFDAAGTITAINEAQRYPFRVQGNPGDRAWPLITGGACFGPHELILAEPAHVHEMLNDVEGQQLVRNIHDRKEKTL
jgi:hypothetical protein